MQLAMKYELLLRQVYQCDRNTSKGADAAIYRAMELANTEYRTKVLYHTHDEREYQRRQKFAAVRTYVARAIMEGIQQIQHVASAEVIRELVTVQESMTSSFYDKEKLDEIIEKSSMLFHKNGLVI
jgi:hypothetical protein